jgi:oligopeptide transport system substrate-binding protein
VASGAAGRRSTSHLRPWLLCCPLLLFACRGQDAERPVVVDIFGQPADLTDPLHHDRQPTGQSALGATAQGLVAFDAQGDVVAALAESWIVIDDGQTYIFRLRHAKWANGQPVKADAVAHLLQQRMKASADLLAGLEPKIRAMTDRIIEIRLETAVPAFIQLLAQPRLGILGRDGGTGPYASEMAQRRLYLRPVAGDTVDDSDDVGQAVRPIDRRTLEATKPSVALVRFQNGEADLVLGGRFQDLLLIPNVRLGSTDVRADPAPGLFGLAIVGKSAFFADHSVRDALSRAVDRAQLAAALNLQGWTTTTAPLPAQLDLPHPPTVPDWATSLISDRAAAAQSAINRWKSAHGVLPSVRVALPAGAGATLLFNRLVADYGKLGLGLQRVGLDDETDLRLIDEVASFDSALWYLSRLDCAAGVICDEKASAYLEQARTAETSLTQAAALSEAERLTVSNAAYIPLGLPIRWSLVSRRLTGFSPSPRAIHPLNGLFRTTN